MSARWDIFCSVVDNYGDIGVTWRLARQLAAEHGLQVRLWVDEPEAFRRICPGSDPLAATQLLHGVEIRHWPACMPEVEVGDVVIEAFACALPESFVEAMVARSVPPLWLNLEYLSAEDWVAGCHGLPSPQSNGLRKFFFFPGFVEGSGGLLREAGLLERRSRFQRDEAARCAMLTRLGVEPLAGAQLISLFAYENAALPAWLDALAQSPVTTQLLVPRGRIEADLLCWLGVSLAVEGDYWRRGNLQVHLLPFVSQEDYDHLLWCCDVNAVRGEDSFVRAQWAGRPLLWHIYQQEEGAHWDKLDAFLALYAAGLPEEARAALVGCWHAWNGRGDMATAWKALYGHAEVVAVHAENWCRQQASRPDLAAALVQFHRNWLSCAA